MGDDDPVSGLGDVIAAQVAAAVVLVDVLGDVKGPKVISFDYKRRKGYRKISGGWRSLTGPTWRIASTIACCTSWQFSYSS